VAGCTVQEGVGGRGRLRIELSGDGDWRGQGRVKVAVRGIALRNCTAVKLTRKGGVGESILGPVSVLGRSEGRGDSRHFTCKGRKRAEYRDMAAEKFGVGLGGGKPLPWESPKEGKPFASEEGGRPLTP